MIPITTDSGSYGVVEVPKNSYEHQVVGRNFYYQLPKNAVDKGVYLPEGEYEILGEIIIDKEGEVDYEGFEGKSALEILDIYNAIESQTGILFKNPIGEEPREINFRGRESIYRTTHQLWYFYEKQILGKDKKLIVLRIKK